MNLQTYLERRAQSHAPPKFRVLCVTCLQPEFTCYCAHVRTFNPQTRFVILIHPIEWRRRIASGRMSHLCLENSQLIQGFNYTHNVQVNEILNDPSLYPVILYPGANSTNLSHLTPAEKNSLFPHDREPVIFVIDGTWSTARKMLRRSLNLQALPRLCFSPPRPSTFRVRQQPKPECYSTLEAIHHTIELLGPTRGFDPASRQHDRLLYVFDKMVEQQLEFIRQSHARSPHSRHRKGRERIRTQQSP